MRRFGLKAKFTIWITGFVICLMAGVISYFTRHEGEALYKEIRKRALAVTSSIIPPLIEHIYHNDEIAIATTLQKALDEQEDMLYATLVNRENKVISSSAVNPFLDIDMRIGKTFEGFKNLSYTDTILMGKDTVFIGKFNHKLIRSFVVYDVCIELPNTSPVLECHVGVKKSGVKKVINEFIKETSPKLLTALKENKNITPIIQELFKKRSAAYVCVCEKESKKIVKMITRLLFEPRFISKGKYFLTKNISPKSKSEIKGFPVTIGELTIKYNKKIDIYDIKATLTRAKIPQDLHMGFSAESIKNTIKEAQKNMLIVAAIAVGAGAAIIIVLVSLIIGSLGEITKDIVAIGEGELDRYKRMEIKRNDEIGDIALSVKEMAMKLEKAQKELVEKERMKREMEIAKDIQAALLPRGLPQFPGFELSAFYQAAREVGGDYYDVLNVDDKHFGLVVADVSGKSVSGAMMMAVMRTVMKMKAVGNPSPVDVIAQTNEEIAKDIPEDIFITTLYIVVNKETGEIRVCNAGHNEGLLLTDGELIPLKPEGMPIGIGLVDEKGYREALKEERRVMKKGDVLVLFTDGITEAMNELHQEFGEDRFFKVLKENRMASAREITEAVMKKVREFTGNIPQSDDITLVVLKRV